jgi:proliferating cell nuclear antigen
MNSDKIVKLTTEHSSEIKTLFDVLKDILTEVNISFLGNPEQSTLSEGKNSSNNLNSDNKDSGSGSDSESDSGSESDSESGSDSGSESGSESKTKPINKSNKKNPSKLESAPEQKKIQGGIKIVALDDHQTLMIYVKLNSDNFTEYYVKYKVVNIGLDLRELHKFMKGVDKDCMMTMSIDKDDHQKIEFHLQNPLKGIEKYYRQKLLDTDDNTKRMPKETEFEMTVLMDTGEFKKLCSEMSQFAEHIEIICTNKEIIFKCSGDSSDLTMKFKSGDNNKGGVKILSLNKDQKKTPIVQGIYNLKHLVTFGKCVNLCNDMQLYLRNSYPLFIHYMVGSLGKMLVGLSPIDEKIIKQSNHYEENVVRQSFDLEDKIKSKEKNSSKNKNY